ncbi:hypothetical protein SLS60_003633 [Paraconiothyrium brasiliense]|uniref:Uncharacterized protein n=1 Tax=Paraconiothyrium brasiliense TaxID=300254 RepID=A0ABR3RP74_9PLEO
MQFTTVFIAASSLAGSALAICPGFNYGIGNQQKLGGGISRWSVYDDSCKVVDSLTTTKNPCTQGIFGCSPAPIHFNSYTNTFNHLNAAQTLAPASVVAMSSTSA